MSLVQFALQPTPRPEALEPRPDPDIHPVLVVVSVYAMIITILIAWVVTIPEPPAQHYRGKSPGRLLKPPGRALPGFAEARGLSR